MRIWETNIADSAYCCGTWESVDDGAIDCFPSPTWETWMELLVSGFGLANAGCCGHLENETAKGKFSLFLSHSLLLPFKEIANEEPFSVYLSKKQIILLKNYNGHRNR